MTPRNINITILFIAVVTVPSFFYSSSYLHNAYQTSLHYHDQTNSKPSPILKKKKKYSLAPPVINVFWFYNHTLQDNSEMRILCKILESRSRYVLREVDSIEKADLVFLGDSVKTSGARYVDEDFFGKNDPKDVSSHALIVHWSGEKDYVPDYFSEKHNFFVDVSVGHPYGPLESSSALFHFRMPYGILTSLVPETCNFRPAFYEASKKDVFRSWQDRPLNASFFASHLSYPREDMVKFSKDLFGHVASGGKALHNIDEPYPAPKEKYFRKSKFAICPENSKVEGYITEKVFQALENGAIPIYWPWSNPEPNVLNPNRIIAYNPEDPAAAENHIIRLLGDEEYARTFFQQPILVEGAQKFLHSICDDFTKEIIARLEGLKRPGPDFLDSPYFCTNQLVRSLAQEGQDVFLFRTAFQNVCRGTFVEIGGADGRSNSNTYGAEMDMGWQGILIEANPKSYERMSRRFERTHSLKIFGAIGDKESNVTYLQIEGPQAQLSCVKEFAMPEHLNRIEREMKASGVGKIKNVTVPMKPLHTWLLDNNMSHVNWLSLDVEGAELNVLKTLDFSKVQFDFIQIEENGAKSDLEEFLAAFDFFLYKPWMEQTALTLDIVFCHVSVCPQSDAVLKI